MIEYHRNLIFTLLLHLMWNFFDMVMGTGDLYKKPDVVGKLS